MPVFIEQGLQPTLPLNHARIGYKDADGTYAATSAASDSPPIAAKSWQTFERWRPASSPATLTREFEEQQVSYIGIGAHTLSTADSKTIEVKEGGEWVALDMATIDIAPDNEAVMLLINQRAISGVRVMVEYTGTAPSIGKLAAGLVLEMDRPFYQGHSPAMLNRDTVRTPSVSQGGEWLGTTVIRQGRSTQMAWQNIKATRYRSKFEPLVEHAQRFPFFAAWNPLQFVDCIYAIAQGDISPTNSGPRDLMSVTIDIKAYSDGTRPVLTLYPGFLEFYPESTENPGTIDIAANSLWPEA